MEIQKGGFLSIEQVTNQYLNSSKKVSDTQKNEGFSFKEILQNKSEALGQPNLKFSKHAVNRLSDRGIELSDEQMNRLENGAKKAEQKGIKDSLVIVDQLAFIVNIPNQTVVTAMDSTQTDENIFTNISGAVIM